MLFQKWINKRIEAYQSDLLQKYCDEVESMYTKMRGWRHDYHNHIQAFICWGLFYAKLDQNPIAPRFPPSHVLLLLCLLCEHTSIFSCFIIFRASIIFFAAYLNHPCSFYI